MVSFPAHITIGILVAELVLRLKYKDSAERAEKRINYWVIGLLFGFLPDVDVIPAVILGVHAYTFHHIFTHTFLALAILLTIALIVRKWEYSVPMFAAYSSHLLADFIDNSIAPWGPIIPNIEWGIWYYGPIPGGSWASEYWLQPGYETHSLWTFFLSNGWGIPIGTEFLSYYDLVLIGIGIVLITILLVLIVKKLKNRK